MNFGKVTYRNRNLKHLIGLLQAFELKLKSLTVPQARALQIFLDKNSLVQHPILKLKSKLAAQCVEVSPEIHCISEDGMILIALQLLHQESVVLKSK